MNKCQLNLELETSMNFKRHIPLRWSGRLKRPACYRHIALLERNPRNLCNPRQSAIQTSYSVAVSTIAISAEVKSYKVYTR